MSIVLLSPTEAAARLGVSRGTLAIWRHYRRYALAYIKVGRLVRYREQDIERFLSSRRATPAQKTGGVAVRPPLTMLENIARPDGRAAVLALFAEWLSIHGAKEGDILAVSDSDIERFAVDFDQRLAAVRHGGESPKELREKMEQVLTATLDELFSARIPKTGVIGVVAFPRAAH
jgi:excisionase family DNA binding protein